MTLADTGPLVALIDRGEREHTRCVAALTTLTVPLVTTWAVVTEAMYLLSRGGWLPQSALWRIIRGGGLIIPEPEGERVPRMYALMEQYRDTPMDFADASLVALAEQTGERQIFTLDAHFRAYRLHGRQHFALLP